MGEAGKRVRTIALPSPAISGYITGHNGELPVTAKSQKRAVENYRNRLRRKGLVRFEVLGRNADRDLVRSIARRLAEDDADAGRIRTLVKDSIAANPAEDGGILRALRRSPLVGANLALSRPKHAGRRIKL